MCFMNCNSLRESYTHFTFWNNAQYINPQEFLLLQKLCFGCYCTCVCVCVQVIGDFLEKMEIKYLSTFVL